MHRTNPRPSPEAIAVVGAACRLPGGINSLDDLWATLAAGRDVITEVPADRFEASRFVDPDRPRAGRSYTGAGGFLDDITGFDSGFFGGISPREAARMDPQQRVLLELAVEALDDAAIDPAGVAGSDGAVFIGCSSRDFGFLLANHPEASGVHSMTGMAGGNTANRVSHLLDWHGQSVTVDTACSSALVALHQACEHLSVGASRLALAGGINILLDPMLFAGFSSASMLSPTGRCHTFSARADGYVRAEGGGLVLLKRLHDALADGDRVHAVIAASGTNNDGRTNGLAKPSATAQEALLRQVYDRAGIDPERLVYLEAHGTGTPIGDPIECQAIGRALGSRRAGGPLPIGSVKTNLGHLESGSGMPGLFKAMLVLRHGLIPPSLHAEPLNPDIDFDAGNLRPAVGSCEVPITADAVVGVNSFGFGGSNAHVVVGPGPHLGRSAESAGGDPSASTGIPSPDPVAGESRPTAGPVPVIVSARTREALALAAGKMADRLTSCDPSEFYDLAYTSTVRRARHAHRIAVIAADPQGAGSALGTAATLSDTVSGVAVAQAVRHGRIAFAFSGNGSQWAGMCADLFRNEPVFRRAVEQADKALWPHLGWSVTEKLKSPPATWQMAATEVAQPMLFAVQVGLVELLGSFGVRPAAVVGHSVGEIAAAYVAGALDLASAALVVAVRSRTQAATAGQGRMAAVGLGADDTAELIARYDGALEIAGVNSSRYCTVSGEIRALAEFGQDLADRGVFFRELDLDYAFHSSAMNPIEAPLRAGLHDLLPASPGIPMVSTVTGALLADEVLDAGYWWRNIREPVRFADAVNALAAADCDVFVEIGPHPVLSPYIRRSAGLTVDADCGRSDVHPARRRGRRTAHRRRPRAGGRRRNRAGSAPASAGPGRRSARLSVAARAPVDRRRRLLGPDPQRRPGPASTARAARRRRGPDLARDRGPAPDAVACRPPGRAEPGDAGQRLP